LDLRHTLYVPLGLLSGAWPGVQEHVDPSRFWPIFVQRSKLCNDWSRAWLNRSTTQRSLECASINIPIKPRRQEKLKFVVQEYTFRMPSHILRFGLGRFLIVGEYQE
jgi:hypothetical protein